MTFKASEDDDDGEGVSSSIGGVIGRERRCGEVVRNGVTDRERNADGVQGGDDLWIDIGGGGDFDFLDLRAVSELLVLLLRPLRGDIDNLNEPRDEDGWREGVARPPP